MTCCPELLRLLQFLCVVCSQPRLYSVALYIIVLPCTCFVMLCVFQYGRTALPSTASLNNK